MNRKVLLVTGVVSTSVVVVALAYRFRGHSPKSPFLIDAFADGSTSRSEVYKPKFIAGHDCPLHEELSSTPNKRRYTLEIGACEGLEIGFPISKHVDFAVDFDDDNPTATELHWRLRAYSHPDELKPTPIGETWTENATFGKIHATRSYTRVEDHKYSYKLELEQSP